MGLSISRRLSQSKTARDLLWRKDNLLLRRRHAKWHIDLCRYGSSHGNFGNSPARGRHRLPRKSHHDCIRRFRVNDLRPDVHILGYWKRAHGDGRKPRSNHLPLLREFLREFISYICDRTSESLPIDDLELPRRGRNISNRREFQIRPPHTPPTRISGGRTPRPTKSQTSRT